MYCNYKGCTNKANLNREMRELRDKDGDVLFVEVNICSEHFKKIKNDA